MHKIFTLALVVGGALVAAGVLSATPIIVAPVACPVSIVGATSSGTITCNKVSAPAGSTVTSITLTLTGNMNGTISVTNNDTASSHTFSETIFSNGSLTNAQQVTDFGAVNPILAMSMGVTSITLAAGGGNYTNNALAGSNAIRTLTGPGLISYVGAGTFLIPMSFSGGVTFESDGNNWTHVETGFSNVSATIGYTYDTIPEPLTLVMMGSGLLALGALRLRKRS